MGPKESKGLSRDDAIIVGIIILVIGVLIALGKDITEFIAFLVVAVVPIVGNRSTQKRVSEVAEDVKEAKDSSAQAVKNTNGNITRLLDIIQENGLAAPDGYEYYHTNLDSGEYDKHLESGSPEDFSNSPEKLF